MQKIFIKTLSLVIVFSTLAFTSPVFATEGPGVLPEIDGTQFDTVEDDVAEAIVPYFTILPYDNTTPVQSLTVTAESNQTFTTPSSHTFTENGTYTFIVIAPDGTASLYPVTVTNIQRAAPVITILPYTTTSTQGPITVTATSTAKFIVEAPETYTQNEDGTYTATYTFTENGTHVFTVMDSFANTAKETVTVENIDNIGPGIDTLPYNTEPTTESIVVTAITDEGAYFTSPNPLTITENGTYEFIAKDAAGNESSYSITITNIIPRVVNTSSGSRGGSSGGTIDKCSNITGVQAILPAGYVVDGNRNCTLPTVVTNPVGQVLGAETEGQVLGAEKFKFTLDLKFGDKNDEVMELQKRLIADGLMTGPATGLFWTKTLAGVREFQRLNGIRTTNGVIKTTGNVGILTRAALNK